MKFQEYIMLQGWFNQHDAGSYENCVISPFISIVGGCFVAHTTMVVVFT
jgi:hypothetical protein